MIKLIIFDVWNTLAYLKGFDKATKQIKKILGKDRFGVVAALLESGKLNDLRLDESIQKLKGKMVISNEEDKMLRDWLDYRYFELYDETMETLKFLEDNGIKMAVVSNSPPTETDALAQMGIKKFFDYVAISFEVGCVKPSKEIFELVLDKLKIDKAETLMVGDSLRDDVRGAEQAGIRGVLIDRKNKIQDDQIINSLAELKKLF